MKRVLYVMKREMGIVSLVLFVALLGVGILTASICGYVAETPKSEEHTLWVPEGALVLQGTISVINAELVTLDEWKELCEKYQGSDRQILFLGKETRDDGSNTYAATLFLPPTGGHTYISRQEFRNPFNSAFWKYEGKYVGNGILRLYAEPTKVKEELLATGLIIFLGSIYMFLICWRDFKKVYREYKPPTET